MFVQVAMSAVAAIVGLLLATTLLVSLYPVAGQDVTRTSSATPQRTRPNASAYLDPYGPDVQFVLFTRNYRPYNLRVHDYEGLQRSGFEFKNPTKIIVHGFLNGIRDEFFTVVKDAYLAAGDYNVFGMDWSVLCEFEYFSAMKGAQLAGDSLADFLKFLLREGVNYESIHIIGHSLGAHVSGMGSGNIKGGKISRITGLDPAGPGYSEVPPNISLDPGDAHLVDIIHTYMRVLSLAEPLGHVDFYPNGGSFQPGCPDIRDIWKVPAHIACNHGRAYMYFAESIRNNNSFKCAKCKTVEDAIHSRCVEESDVYMGQADTYKSGLYYVKTNPQPPFSLIS